MHFCTVVYMAAFVSFKFYKVNSLLSVPLSSTQSAFSTLLCKEFSVWLDGAKEHPVLHAYLILYWGGEIFFQNNGGWVETDWSILWMASIHFRPPPPLTDGFYLIKGETHFRQSRLFMFSDVFLYGPWKSFRARVFWNIKMERSEFKHLILRSNVYESSSLV